MDSSNPSLADIEKFVRSNAHKQDKNGIISCLRKDMCQAAGVSERMAGPIMQFCQGEGVYLPAPEAAKQIRIQFASVIPSMTAMERSTRDAIMALGVERDGDTWMHVDIDALADHLNVQVPAALKRLYNMSEKHMLTMVKPDSRAPLRVGRDWSEVPQVSKDRIHTKHQNALAEFRKVLTYIEIPDDEKQQYLSNCLPQE